MSDIAPAEDPNVIDFDSLIAEEVDEVEADYKTFKYKGRVWKASPRIGVGSIRKLVRAEKKGDQFAAIGFLAAIVEDPDWEDVMDRMPTEHAVLIVRALLKQYGGDDPAGK